MAKGMRRMQGTRRMFTRIPGNLLEDSRECSYFSIPGNPQEDSGECSRRFRRMLLNIPGGEGGGGGVGRGVERFWGMFKKIPGNLNFYLFLEILLAVHQILLLNCYKTIEKTIAG